MNGDRPSTIRGVADGERPGREIWRPLCNPVDLQFSVFGQSNPRGFGMMQRVRIFADYQDLEARYDKRPKSLDRTHRRLGPRRLDLVEIPTANETNDNIVSFWRQKDNTHRPWRVHLHYRMHWAGTRVADAAWRGSPRHSLEAGSTENTRIFVIDSWRRREGQTRRRAVPAGDQHQQGQGLSNVLSPAETGDGGMARELPS